MKNFQKQKQKPSTFLRAKIKTFNLQKQKQKPSIFLTLRTRTFNFFKSKSKSKSKNLQFL